MNKELKDRLEWWWRYPLVGVMQPLKELIEYEFEKEYNKEGKVINAFEQIIELDNLILSYESIKSNPGNLTPGIDDKTLDRIEMNDLTSTQQRVIWWEILPSLPCEGYSFPNPTLRKKDP